MPVLIRRIAAEVDPALTVRVRVLRTPKSRLVRPGELERAVDMTARRIAERGGLLVLLDGDEDCPAQLGPALLHRARATRADLPLAVVLAKREFESWFIAAADSLRGLRGLSVDLQAAVDPEGVRGAKEWLTDRMPPGSSYSATVDQPALAARFDLAAARHADSFDKCYRDIAGLLAALKGG